MTASPTSPFAVCQGEDQSALLEFLERQTDVLGVLDRPLVWDALQGRSNLSLIDFGCGEGGYLESLVSGAPGSMFAAVCGVDIHPDWIRIAQRRRLPPGSTFRLADICERQSWCDGQDGQFDVVFSRFTLISAKDPQSAIRNAYRCLKAGGLMIAIESSYSVAQAINTSPVMTEFCERLITWYERAGSHPDLGLELWRRLAQGGFDVRRDLVVLYGNNTLDKERFASFTAMTARSLGAVFEDIFPESYCSTLYRCLSADFADGRLGCMATNFVVAEKH